MTTKTQYRTTLNSNGSPLRRYPSLSAPPRRFVRACARARHKTTDTRAFRRSPRGTYITHRLTPRVVRITERDVFFCPPEQNIMLTSRSLGRRVFDSRTSRESLRHCRSSCARDGNPVDTAAYRVVWSGATTYPATVDPTRRNPASRQ